jgi:hypothetical protein
MPAAPIRSRLLRDARRRNGDRSEAPRPAAGVAEAMTSRPSTIERMLMDSEQDRRFREAVERKKQESETASAAGRQNPAADAGVQGDQEDLRSPSQPQDTFSVREKNSRHKKVTADKWNQ